MMGSMHEHALPHWSFFVGMRSRNTVLQNLRPPIVALRAFFVETQLVADHAKSEMLVGMRCKVG